MLHIDENFYLLPRGEQVARMVEYCCRLTADTGAQQASSAFIPEFLEAVSGRYQPHEDFRTDRPQRLYNSAVLNVLTALLNDTHQDVDTNTLKFLEVIQNPATDGKTRHLAMVGIHTLVEMDTPFVVSAATAAEVAETLASVALNTPLDRVLRCHCIETIGDLIKQSRVELFSDTFLAVSKLPEAVNDPVFSAPQRHYN